MAMLALSKPGTVADVLRRVNRLRFALTRPWQWKARGLIRPRATARSRMRPTVKTLTA